MTRPKMSKHMAVLLMAICTMALLVAGNLRAAERSKSDSESPAKHYERPTDPSLYVGSEVCKTCHEDIFKNFETTPHFVTTLENKRGPEWQGCEACHGPGKEHVESGGDKTKIFTFQGVSAEASSARCLDCHFLRRRAQ